MGLRHALLASTLMLLLLALIGILVLVINTSVFQKPPEYETLFSPSHNDVTAPDEGKRTKNSQLTHLKWHHVSEEQRHRLVERSSEQRTYGIVLDAGSSHTSMYVYKWLSDKQNGTGIVTQHDECDVAVNTVTARKACEPEKAPCKSQCEVYIVCDREPTDVQGLNVHLKT
ncbi:hypothetical protein WMY93_004168 [Mugilogobius chulae]|uniref:Uncharacterized protein n=1 Tax=Mugilogobius chulae TaxID=88201 RepID=A0AAW0PMZ7_9GOBI